MVFVNRAPAIPLSRFVTKEYDDYEEKQYSIEKINRKKNFWNIEVKKYVVKIANRSNVFYNEGKYWWYLTLVYKKYDFQTYNDFLHYAWVAAGGKFNDIFKLQVRSGIYYKHKLFRNDFEAFKKFVEVQQWIWNNWGEYSISVKNALRIHPLSDSLRKASLKDASRFHLNWQNVRKVQNLLNYFKSDALKVKFVLSQSELDDESFRPECYRYSKIISTYCGNIIIRNYDGIKEWNSFWYSEQIRIINEYLKIPYPNLPFHYSKLLILGMSPVEICKQLLNKSEAHDFLSLKEGYEVSCSIESEILQYLSQKLKIKLQKYNLVLYTYRIRSIKIIRWLNFVLDSEKRRLTLSKTIENHLPGGEIKYFTCLDIIDEIQDSDIRTGKDRVEDVIKRTSSRQKLTYLNKIRFDREPLNKKLPIWTKRLPEGFTLLNTNEQLVNEGKELGHCVGTYGEAVKNGQSYIIANSKNYIDLEGNEGNGINYRSTVELTEDGDILQHKGYSDSEPYEGNQDALDIWLEREFGKRIEQSETA